MPFEVLAAVCGRITFAEAVALLCEWAKQNKAFLKRVADRD